MMGTKEREPRWRCCGLPRHEFELGPDRQLVRLAERAGPTVDTGENACGGTEIEHSKIEHSEELERMFDL
jgi:hypothetical protein